MSAELRRFEDFELDPNSCELRRNGRVIHLERIPLELLTLLVERDGEVVTREEILERVWGKGVFIDTEASINTAVRKIRRALGDDVDAPRFVVTIPAKGYRFVTPVVRPNGELIANGASVLVRPATGAPSETKLESVPKYWRIGAFSAATLAVVVAAGLLMSHFAFRALNPIAGVSSMPGPARQLPREPSVAVLPFANLSGDPREDIFIDGLTDNLINSLSRLPTLFVIARTSTFAYKGKPTKAREISRELGVKYLVEGSVNKTGDRIRVNTQLVDGASGDQLWAESYDRPLGDVFALQDEIVKKIVTTLMLELNLWERGDFSAKAHGTRNQEAYNFLLRAGGYHSSFTREGNAKEREMAEKAAALDPDYADAYTVLGWTYCYDWIYQWTNNFQALANASEMAKRAVAADDANSGAHVLLGYTHMLSGQFREAFAEDKRAIALDPNSTAAYAMDALVLAVSGKPAEAAAAAETAMRLDPHNHAVDQLTLGYVYVYAKRYTDAVVLLEQHLARNSNDSACHIFLAIAYSEIGRDTDARAHMKEALRINPDYSLSVLKQRTPPIDPALAQRWFADLSRSGLK